jgi:hypothetical protein
MAPLQQIVIQAKPAHQQVSTASLVLTYTVSAVAQPGCTHLVPNTQQYKFEADFQNFPLACPPDNSCRNNVNKNPLGRESRAVPVRNRLVDSHNTNLKAWEKQDISEFDSYTLCGACFRSAHGTLSSGWCSFCFCHSCS